MTPVFDYEWRGRPVQAGDKLFVDHDGDYLERVADGTETSVYLDEGTPEGWECTGGSPDAYPDDVRVAITKGPQYAPGEPRRPRE